MGNKKLPFTEQLIADLAKEEPPDDEGLTAKQKRFLRFRLYSATDDEAMKQAKVSFAEWIRWQNDPGFLDSYALISPATDRAIAKARSRGLLNRALDTLESAMDGGDVSKEQRWATEHVLKMEGMEVVKVETTTTNMPPDARIAIAMLERGVSLAELPPALRDIVTRWFPQHPAVRGTTAPLALTEGQ